MQSRYPHKGLNKNKEPPAWPAALYFYFLIHMIKILASGTSTLLNQAAPVSFNGFKAFLFSIWLFIEPICPLYCTNFLVKSRSYLDNNSTCFYNRLKSCTTRGTYTSWYSIRTTLRRNHCGIKRHLGKQSALFPF